MKTTDKAVTDLGKAPSFEAHEQNAITDRLQKQFQTDSRTVAGVDLLNYPEREQRLELALIKVIKYHFGTYEAALKWADQSDQYRDNPQANHALLSAINAIESK